MKNIFIYKLLLPKVSYLTTSQRFYTSPGNEKWKKARLRFFKRIFLLPITPSYVSTALFKWKEKSQYPCKRTAFGDISFKLNFTKWRRINFLSSHFNNTRKLLISPHLSNKHRHTPGRSSFLFKLRLFPSHTYTTLRHFFLFYRHFLSGWKTERIRDTPRMELQQWVWGATTLYTATLY